jgi:Xaa-Pro dipeptidase
MFDAHAVHHVSALPAVLADLATPAALVHVLPQTALYPALPAPALASLSSSDCAPPSEEFLLDAVQRARLIKDAHELSLIRKANAISSRAHETVMRVLGAAVRAGKAGTGAGAEGRAMLPGEWMIEREEEAEAIFVATCRRAGCGLLHFRHRTRALMSM